MAGISPGGAGAGLWKWEKEQKVEGQGDGSVNTEGGPTPCTYRAAKYLQGIFFGSVLKSAV